MTNKKGKLIVIDGLDGSGKSTQAQIVVGRLTQMGYNVKYLHFPNYASLSSGPVRMYLNGEISSNLDEINPYVAASFYMADRAITYIKDLKRFLEESENNVVVCDRYISSNILHQVPRIADDKEQEKFIKWCYETETKSFELPVEDLCLVLTLHPKVSQKLLSSRYDNDETKKDLHENNLDYLKNCYEAIYKSVNFCKDELKLNWTVIDCNNLENTDIRSIDSITKSIWVRIENFLNS